MCMSDLEAGIQESATCYEPQACSHVHGLAERVRILGEKRCKGGGRRSYKCSHSCVALSEECAERRGQSEGS